MSEELSGDVIDLLQRKRDHYAQQIKMIEKMLSIATDGSHIADQSSRTQGFPSARHASAPKTNIPWTSHIRKVFADNSAPLSLQQVRDALVASGVADAETIAANANTITGITARLVGNRELERLPDKTIKRGPKHPHSIGGQAPV